MKASKRLLALILAALMIISTMPVFAQAAGAYGFSDFPVGSWSEEAVTAAVNNGLLEGKGYGILGPKDNLTRAEAATVINRAFGATVKADISEFTDVKKSDWYYEEFQKAVNMGTIVGEGNGIINPNGFITREAMFTVIARALVLSDPAVTALDRFHDGDQVSTWAAAYVSALAKRGYVNGDDKGYLNPGDYITREEFAQVMHNIFKVYVSNSGEISDKTYGTTIIRVPGLTLSDMVISGDLILGDGVGAGDVTLNNVVIGGRLLCRGGEGTVDVTGNSTVGEMVVVHDVNGVVNFHNYKTEKFFEGIVLDTEATFLGTVGFGGGGGSSTTNANYEIITYKEKINERGEYDKVSSQTKRAKKGKEIIYTPEKLEGFTINEKLSELSGKNNGSLKIKVYYDRNAYTVTFDGKDYDYVYGQTISSNPELKKALEEATDIPGYKVTLKDDKDNEVSTYTRVENDMEITFTKELITYSISYELDGGKFLTEPLNKYTVESDDYVIPEPVKDGFTFLGWYDNKWLSGTSVSTLPKGSTEDKTFYAKWKDNYVPPAEFTITFNGKYYTVTEGKKLSSNSWLRDAMRDAADEPGYIVTFTDENGNPVTLDTYPVGDMTISVVKKAEVYYITYVLNGGAGDTDGAYTVETDTVTLPVPTRTGYGFDGWYENASFDGKKVTSFSTSDMEDKTFYAKWTATEYTITYEENGGNTVADSKYTIESADITLPTPTRTNYKFLGWYEKSDLSGNKVDKIPAGSTGDKTFYAKWEYVGPTLEIYDITFGGKEYQVTENEKLSSNEELKKAMEEAQDKEGYDVTFNTKADGSGTDVDLDTVPTKDMEIYAVVKAIEYKIVYEENGGNKVNDDTYTIESADVILPTPTRTNYKFLGWYEKSDLSGNKVDKIPAGSTGDKTFYAKWEYVDPTADVYKITFDGTSYDVTEKKPLSSNEELKKAMEEAQDKEGYDVTFNTEADGSGTDVDLDTVPTKDMEIYAVAKAIEYKIVYEENGGNAISDGKYTIESADVVLPTPTRDGYVFKGWYAESDFSGNKVDKVIKGSTGDKIFYAKWAEDNSVLYFDHSINGNVVTVKVMLSAIPADIDDVAAMTLRYSYDATKLEYAGTTSNIGNANSSAGYISWYTTSDYVDADALEDNNNALFTLTFNIKDGAYGKTEISYTYAEIVASEPTGNPAVADKFTKESEEIDLGTKVEEYTITYEENGGDAIPDGTYKATDADITLPIPTRAGYAFKGWYEESDFSGDKVEVLDTADAENKIYYAKWVIETATLDFSSEINGNTIKIYVTLDEIPSDIDDMVAFTFKYKHPDNKLTFVKGSTTFGGNFSAKDGNISWYTTGTAITSESLKAAGNIIATLEFTKTDAASGVETFEYTFAEMVASAPAINPAIAKKYKTETEAVELNAAVYEVTFDRVYNITAGKALSSNAELLAAMNEAQSEKGYNVSFTDGNGNPVTTATIPSGNMVIKTVKTAVTYTVTYKENGGSDVADDTYTVEDADITLPVTTKTGYTFDGWYEESDFSGNAVTVLDTADAENKTYHAKWTRNTYTVTYKENGGSDVADDTYTVEDADITLPVTTKTGYTFDGWYEESDFSGNAVTVLDTADAENKTYHAKWTLNTYTVTYKENGGSDVADDTYTVEDEDITLPVTTRTNYKFLGWYEESDFSGNAVTVLDTADAENKTYYANWEYVGSTLEIYDITFDGKEYQVTENEKLSSNEELKKAMEEAQDKVGYDVTFNTEADGSGTDVDLNTVPTKDMEIYAVAKAIVYTIEYEENGGSDVADDTYTVEDSVTLPGTTKADHIFLGWYEEPDFSGNSVEEIPVGTTGNKKYYANWQYVDPGANVFIVTFLNKDYEVAEGEALSSNNDLKRAMRIAEDGGEGVTITFNTKEDGSGDDVTLRTVPTSNMTIYVIETYETYTIVYKENGGDEIPDGTYTVKDEVVLPTPVRDKYFFDGWFEQADFSGVSVTSIPAGTTGNKTYYAKWNLDGFTVRIFEGYKNDMNLRGEYLIPNGDTLTQQQLDESLGDPAFWLTEEGYMDSDGNYHEIFPELWYEDGGEWKLFDINMPIEKSIDICLIARYFSLSYKTDLEIKGVSIPEISVTVPYDSDTYIGQTFLDTLTITRSTLERILDQLEMQGVYPYDMMLNKLSGIGLVDSDGNILNPNVAIPLHKFITEEKILDEIDRYIDDNIDNEEFIADILRNDAVVEMLLEDESIRIQVMEDSSMRDKLITQSFINEMLADDDLVNKIVSSEDFKKQFIYNDATIEYVLDDDELMDMILNDPEFHKILIDECVKYVIDVYFEETKESPALYNYIEEVLYGDEFIKDIESKPELKDILEDEIKELVKSSDKDTRKEVYGAIRDKNNTTIRKTIIDVIKTDTAIKDDIKAVVQEDTVLKADIKAAVKDSAKDEIKDFVKTWILNKIDADDEIEASFTNYIKSDKNTLRLVLEDVTDVDNSHIDDYINGTLDPVLAADIDTKIDNYLADEANLKYSIDVYFDTFYANSYGDMYDDYFDDFYNDEEIFNVAYDKFVEDDDSFESVFDSFVEDDDNMEKAFDTFTSNDVEFDTFYQQFIVDEDQFNTLFERYYKTHVHDVAKDAYENPDLHDMVQDYIWTYTEELVIEYADGTLETKHPELVDAIDELMHEDVPLALRNAYENNPVIKGKIDSLIETDAVEIIEKYLDNTLDDKTRAFIDDEITKYIDGVIEDYIDGTLDSDIKEFVDKEIDEYMEKLINDYISGADRDTLGDLIPTYAEDAVIAIKKTDAFKNTIKDFVSGKGVRVNEGNIMFVEIIAKIIGEYDYDKLAKDFLPEQITKFIDIVGKNVVEEYAEKYLDVFCTDMNNAVDSLNADLDAGITGTEYKFSTSPAVRINYMEIVDTYYTKVSEKITNKLEAKADVVLIDQNPYLKRLLHTDYMDLLVDPGTLKDDIHSGYALKDGIISYYNAWLEYTVLVHDAITWYGTLDTLTLEQKLDAASLIIGTYANKANDVIMTYIETGELPKGYTPQELADKILDKVLGKNGTVDGAFNKVENLYEANEEKILDLLDKAKTFYAEKLDKDYTEVIDLANMSIYADGEAYPIYQIILETGDNALDADDLITAIFDSDNYLGISKVENAMAKIKSKIKQYEYIPEASTNRYYVDAYKATVDSKTIKGYSTGSHTFDFKRMLR